MEAWWPHGYCAFDRAVPRGSSTGQGHCSVFLGKTLLSRCLSPQVYRWVTSNFDAREKPALDWHLSLHATETRISSFLTWLVSWQNLAIHHLIFLTCLIGWVLILKGKNSFSSPLLIQVARSCQYQSSSFPSRSGLIQNITDNSLKC